MIIPVSCAGHADSNELALEQKLVERLNGEASMILPSKTAVAVMTGWTWHKDLQAFDGPANGTDYELSLSVAIISLKRHFIENHLHPF